jgi:hypothetical protein
MDSMRLCNKRQTEPVRSAKCLNGTIHAVVCERALETANCGTSPADFEREDTMSAIIVPSNILTLRRTERQQMATLNTVAALRSDMARVGRLLQSALDGLTRISGELDHATARLDATRLFGERCAEIWATGDLATMISLREALLHSELADRALSGDAKAHQMAFIAATAR